MKKIKMSAIGNQGKYNYYVFEKTQAAFEKLAKIFYETLSINLKLYKEYHNTKDIEKSKKIFVKNFKDIHKNYNLGASNEKRLDIFYGDKKMFVVIFCPLKLREKLNKELDPITKMPTPKKFKPFKK